MFNVDTSLSKKVRVREQMAIQTRVEVFNALNHPNFAIPSQRTVVSLKSSEFFVSLHEVVRQVSA